MPLDADDKAAGRIFDGFDQSIVSERDRAQVPSGLLNGLMMITVHFQRPPTGELSNQAVFSHADDVPRRRFIVVFVVRDGVADQDGNILDERAAAIYVEALNAETNTQYRHVLL